MRPAEQWIWLPGKQYPDRQTACFDSLSDGSGLYTAAAFTRVYAYGKPMETVELRFSGDTAFRLSLCLPEGGERLIAVGPASAGGDFLFDGAPRPNFYADRLTLSPEATPELAETLAAGRLAFRAEVRMKPARMYEFSRGHGGFMLTADVTFADGSRAVLMTDPTWTARRMTGYVDACRFDDRAPDEAPVPAETVPNRWFCEDSPIPGCVCEERVPAGCREWLTVPAGETRVFDLPLDRIYAAYPVIECRSPGGETAVFAVYYEDDKVCRTAEHVFSRAESRYVSFELQSIGGFRFTVTNNGTAPAELRAAALCSCYPAPLRAVTVTSDPDLDRVTEACAHTLKICRQTLHLDSPMHCEPLACTGDYYIQALMTAFSYGDLRLAAFDVRRTAELLRYHDGRMFHTSYSLIWVQMLWDVYFLTGETGLLRDCEPALALLLNRFASYVGENGLIESPPDYMFIDWLNPDGISTHHPPKALGQTCLCLFYFNALRRAEAIYKELGMEKTARNCASAAEAMRQAVCSLLYDRERGLFFEGLNTPSPEATLNEWLPQNVEKRYYRRHANILAACFGVSDRADCRALLERIAADDTLGEVQPYFIHFWLEAIFRNGLRDSLTMPLLDLWKEPVRSCPKGLAEGFYKPQPTYSFDHSHAWGGTPLYALPLALSGLELLEPGFRRIRLDPSLLGLESARVEIPAPQGMIVLELRRGAAPVITVPRGITLA